ncbi:unnamed protein product [Lactuca saligna]|uniref:Uncharacterized protein n=1 Tax=Lactuca saligna TaxID=75948 RepID=A0AA35Z5Y6_LACSI|nr:unnamed protein product [Lactuca saligna]
MIYGDEEDDLAGFTDDLTMERNIMGSLSIKTENFKVLTVKLEQYEKQIQDLITEKLRPVFAILHRLEGVPEPSIILKQGGDQPKKTSTTSAKPTTSVKPSIKVESERKGKDKLFSKEPIVDNSDEEELDEE